MASSGIGSGRYYCHLCQQSTNPTLNDSVLKCNLCNQGFVEEIEPAENRTNFNDNEPDPELTFFSLISAMDNALGGVAFGINPDVAMFNMPAPELGSSSRRSRTRLFPDTMSALIAQLLANGDLNSFGIGGTPPASATDIDALPRRKLTRDDLKTHDVCSICLEKYKVNDETMSLPCHHSFHQTCLTTWLRQKGSCPICRKDIQGEDTS